MTVEDRCVNIASWLEKNGRSYPLRPAIALGNTVHCNYGEWARNARKIASGLTNRYGCAAGQRVAIVMENRPEYLEVLFGAWHAGMVVVPINARLHGREIAYILNHCDAKVALTSPILADVISPCIGRGEPCEHIVVVGTKEWRNTKKCDGMDLVPRGPDDAAWLFYTSGTTGRPKGATLTHRNLLIMTLSYFADIDAIGPTDAILHAAPLSHGSGLYSLPHIAKAAVNVMPEASSFDPTEMRALLRHWSNASFFSAPTMLKRLIGDADLSIAEFGNLKSAIYGGGPMYVADLKRAIEILGGRLVQIYGQGEAPMTITSLSKEAHRASDGSCSQSRLGSVGIPRTGVEVRICGECGEEQAAGKSGEIEVRSDVVMSGYWKDEESSNSVMHDGWLRTGDIGVFDDTGFLTLIDRSKDVIISGGQNIYPREVEEVLQAHPSVKEVSVVGRSSREWGEEVVAFVVPNEGARLEASELDQLCLKSIARFKRPRAYHFLESLPKSEYGKILKTVLRQRLSGNL